MMTNIKVILIIVLHFIFKYLNVINDWEMKPFSKNVVLRPHDIFNFIMIVFFIYGLIMLIGVLEGVIVYVG